MITHFHREIDQLKDRLLALSAEVERCMEQAQYVLTNLDVESAKRVIAYDKIIDQHEVDIEEECLKIMALYQPVAADLRMVVAILKINNDLERMADLSRNIAEYVLEITKYEPVEIPPRFKEMFVAARQMVHQALDALVNQDPDLALRVCASDAVVDQMNVAIITEVQEQIEQQPKKVRPLLYLISVSRSLERIADNATNICEDVIYMVRGVIVRHHVFDQKGKRDGASIDSGS